MDHQECWKEIGHLEDELDYNFNRKEELKKEVSKLKDQNEDLRDTNFRNVEVYQKVKAEMYELKSKLEIIEKEIEELTINVDQLECAKSVISRLQENIKAIEEEQMTTTKNLKDVNENLQAKINNLLKCDECHQCFTEKHEIKILLFQIILSTNFPVVFVAMILTQNMI